jgi:hypothetical protein
MWQNGGNLKKKIIGGKTKLAYFAEGKDLLSINPIYYCLEL